MATEEEVDINVDVEQAAENETEDKPEEMIDAVFNTHAHTQYTHAIRLFTHAQLYLL